MKERVELTGLHLQQRLVGREQSLGYEVDGDFERGCGRSLAVAGLEHIQLAVLDGEFHILHISVRLFQRASNLGEACVHLGHYLFQSGNRLRRADAGNDVLTLCVHQEFAVGRIAGERYARAACITHVAEHHRLHVDRSAPA